MQVKETFFPTGTLIDLPYLKFDYTDSFSITVLSPEQFKLEDFLRLMFNTNPAWVNFLVKIREVLVKPFDLKTEAEHFPAAISISKGTNISVFEVLELNDDETMLYMHDKHLDAWVSVLLRGLPGCAREVTFTTAVKYHNLLGRIYFFFIRPFHKLIVRTMLKKFTQNLK